MDFAHRWLLLIGALIIVSILLGRLTSRIGAPLLLVFIGLGMLVGDEGIGGIPFGVGPHGWITIDDARVAYLVGSAALTLILLDGGVRTDRASFRLALWPSLILATLGVVITAAITGLVAAPVLGRSWTEGLLVGSIVASTDAAAVFFMLHQRGGRTSERINATLEVESGVNDPAAVFLTGTVVALLAGGGGSAPAIAIDLARQVGLGIAFGAGGGALLVWVMNRLELAAGLYPILVLAAGLATFAGAQLSGGSGYLAVYLAGIVIGNAQFQAQRLVGRFLDGMAWLAQIVLFVMLGLFVSPHSLVEEAAPALLVALTLMFVARPIAVWLCLTPFRFTAQERVFIAWVGLRGAVPIFLAMFPLLADLPGSATFFNVAFITVLASLALQGWTLAPALRWLGLELPPPADPAERLDFDMPAGHGREVAVYRVAAGAPALEYDPADLPMPKRSRIIAVLRDGAVQHRDDLGRLQPRDLVIAVVPLERFERLDRLFAARRRRPLEAHEPLGDFSLSPDASLGEIADLYGLPAPAEERQRTLGDFLRHRLQRSPGIGDRAHFGAVDLVVRAVEGDRITEIGLDLEPRTLPLEHLHLRASLRGLIGRLRKKP